MIYPNGRSDGKFSKFFLSRKVSQRCDSAAITYSSKSLWGVEEVKYYIEAILRLIWIKKEQ